MIKHVDQYQVSSIFSMQNNTVYKIPKYQREYKWGQKDWNLLFDDITDNNDGYLLGSFICVSDSTLGESTLELIDGQQRFTSISLLLVALYTKLLDYKNKGGLDEDEITEVNNLHNQLANKTVSKVDGKKITKYAPKLILQSQNFNNDDYRSILYENKIIDYVDKPLYRGIRRVEKAFKHFSWLIDDYLDDKHQENENAVDTEILLALVEKFNSAIMVGIEVDSHKDAYMLFESLNHRGEPLSAIDLIKNILISVADTETQADECYEKWKKALTDMGDDYAVQERFFRQYYNAFRKELNEPWQREDSTKMYPLGYLATRTTLLDIYEKLIKRDYQSFIDNLGREAGIYSIIVNNSGEDKLYFNDLLDLGRIQGAPSYLLLLYLLTRQDELKLTDTDIQKIVKVLIVFFVRRNITDVPNTRKLTKIFMDIIDSVADKESAAIVDEIHKQLVGVSASEELFEQKLRGAVYDENDTATRFILCAIEAQHQTREIYSDLWARDNSNKYIWTIEHIFPEGENIPKEWVDMIAGGDAALARHYLNNYVHTLGNLTITGYNSNLSNMSFERKKDRKSNKDSTKYIGYRNGLFLNGDVVNQDMWTIEKIKARTDKLVDTAKELFKW